MKRMYFKVFLLILPLIFYLTFFYSNDPHNYFGFERNNGQTLIDRMLSYRNGEYNGLIFGDSRIRKQSFEELDAYTGLKYINMAFDGCTPREMTTLFWWSVKTAKEPIRSVIFVTGFYALNERLSGDRVPAMIKTIANPVSYAFSYDNLYDRIVESDTDSSKIVSTADEKRNNFNAHKRTLIYALQHYKADTATLEEFEKICRYCSENNISVKFVIPPWWKGFWEILDEYGLREEVKKYKHDLAKYSSVYDMEYEESPLSKNYDDYTDYTHFHDNTLKDFRDVLIYEKLSKVRKYGN